jgi:hypothetical protein
MRLPKISPLVTSRYLLQPAFAALIVGVLLPASANANCPQTTGWVCNQQVVGVLPDQTDSCMYFQTATDSTWYAVPLFDFNTSDNPAEPYLNGKTLEDMINQERMAGEPIGFFVHKNTNPKGAAICLQPSTIVTDLRLGAEALQ